VAAAASAHRRLWHKPDIQGRRVFAAGEGQGGQDRVGHMLRLVSSSWFQKKVTPSSAAQGRGDPSRKGVRGGGSGGRIGGDLAGGTQ